MLRNGGWVCNGGWVFDLSVIFFFFVFHWICFSVVALLGFVGGFVGSGEIWWECSLL